MTDLKRIEVGLEQWLEERASPRVPDYVEQMLERTRQTRQRPTWMFAGRQFGHADGGDTLIARQPAWLLLVLALLMAAMLGAAIAVGSGIRPPALISTNDQATPTASATPRPYPVSVPDGATPSSDPGEVEDVVYTSSHPALGGLEAGRRITSMEWVPPGVEYPHADGGATESGRPWWAVEVVAAGGTTVVVMLHDGTLQIFGSDRAAEGGETPSPDPGESGRLASPGPGTLVLHRTDRDTPFEFRVPRDVDFMVHTTGNDRADPPPNGLIAFTTGGPGIYGYRSTQTTSTFVEGARGVVVADVAGATLHGNDKPSLGDDPATFLASLDASRTFQVTQISAVEWAGRAAMSAAARLENVDYSHLDIPEGGSVDFAHPSDVLLTEVGDALVLVQIWAGTDEELAAWTPTARAFVNSFRFADQAAPDE